MRAYHPIMRQAVLAAYHSGKRTKQIAEELGVSTSWARRVKQRRGVPKVRRLFGRRKRMPLWSAYEAEIIAAMEENEFLKLRELKELLGTTLSVQTLCRALQRLGYSKYLPRDRSNW